MIFKHIRFQHEWLLMLRTVIFQITVPNNHTAREKVKKVKEKEHTGKFSVVPNK